MDRSTWARWPFDANGEAPEQDRQAVEAAGLPVVQPDVAGRSDVVLASRDFRL